jgi:DNA polymerase-4
MNAVARTVTVKLRFANFQTVERSHSVACATAAASTVNEIVDQLLADLWRDFDTVRLVGVRLSGLAELANVGEQLTLADVSTDQHGFDKIADQIVDRFGSQALTSARLLLPKERPEAR